MLAPVAGYILLRVAAGLSILDPAFGIKSGATKRKARMKQTALYDTHVRLGGRMVDFSGWELPVQYPTGPTEEHRAVRNAAGLFDIDHMGQLELTGEETLQFLQRVQVADVGALGKTDSTYSMLTYADGTIADDIFLYNLPGRWLMVVNAANRVKDLAWLQAHTSAFEVSVTDVSAETYMLALQGPAAERILQPLTTYDLSQMPPRRAAETDIAGVMTMVSRTGYTGEDGFELYLPSAMAMHMWDELVEAGDDHGLLPCGLAARDSLRFEAGMPLYGHEINATTNPIEARLGWAVHLDHDFIGRSAILKTRLEGAHRRLVGLEMLDRAVPREGYAIESEGQMIGHVTSGMHAPTLGRFLAMGYVRRSHSTVGTQVDIVVRGRRQRAAVVKRPFYRRSD